MNLMSVYAGQWNNFCGAITVVRSVSNLLPTLPTLMSDVIIVHHGARVKNCEIVELSADGDLNMVAVCGGR
jgi:hypothetical protein